MKIEYDPWQQEILDCKGHVLLNKGRQTGGTETFAHKAGRYLMDNPNHQIVCVSDTLEQAENIIIMVLDYLEDKCYKDVDRGKHKPTKTRVWLNNKAHIISRPVGNTGDAVRSFTGNILYVDEASLMPRSFWTAAKPILFTTGGDIWASSTPKGKYEKGKGTRPTYYYEAYVNKHKRFTVIENTSEWVANKRKIGKYWTLEKRKNAIQHLKEEKESMSETEYAQEYLGRFMDDVAQWYPDDLTISCQTLERPETISKNATFFLGIDVARMGEDESTFQIFEMRGDHLYQVESQITRKTTLPQTFNHIKGLHALYDFSKIFIDSGGLGVGVYDWLMYEDTTKWITERIDNSMMIKDRDGNEKTMQKTLKYTHCKMLMEVGRLHLLKDDKIFQSFKSVQYAYTNDNLGTRHLKIFGNYTHIVEGVANAVWGEKAKDLNLEVHSIPV